MAQRGGASPDYFCRNAGAAREFCATDCGRQPDRIDPSFRFFPGYGYGEREARGLELLKEWLTPEQIAQYDAKSYFEVTGCHSGKRYRISHGTSMNIHELDGAGCPCVGWCFAPKGHLVAGDVMLAQKIALETDERGALNVANKFFCQQPDEICISITELVIDFIAPDGRAENLRMK